MDLNFTGVKLKLTGVKPHSQPYLQRHISSLFSCSFVPRFCPWPFGLCSAASCSLHPQSFVPRVLFTVRSSVGLCSFQLRANYHRTPFSEQLILTGTGYLWHPNHRVDHLYCGQDAELAHWWYAISCFLLPLPPKVKEVMFSSLSVCLSVSVCLCTVYLKKLWADLDEICWMCGKDKLIRFWWRYESGFGYENYLIFKVILHHWEIGPKTI